MCPPSSPSSPHIHLHLHLPPHHLDASPVACLSSRVRQTRRARTPLTVLHNTAKMSDTEVDYLQPDFDPTSVTMPRLRSILVSHNVPYPATAKKAQLVETFNEHVTPQAKKILDRRARAKRSSMGITNADNSAGYSVANDDMPPPSTTKSRGRPKRNPASAASSFKSESVEPEQRPEQRTLSPRKQRQSRASSRQLGYSDTDTDSQYEARRSPRKSSRRAELTPQPEAPVYGSEDDPDAVFSTENPFQSGSSPLPEDTPVARRRTANFDSPAKRTPSSSSVIKRTPSAGSAIKRRSEGPKADASDRQAYSKSVDAPPLSDFSRSRKLQTPEPIFEASQENTIVDASEEFTPEEQLALSQEDAARAQTAVVPHRQKRSGSFATPIWVLLLTLLGAYGTWYRQEKVAVGYCGVGRPTQEVIPRHISYQDYDVEVPEWAIKLAEPECEPCPNHGYCYADNSVRCEDDYILKPHPLSAGGLVPLPPTCEPDGEKVRRVNAVANKAIEELRDRRAKFECGELVDGNGQQPNSPAIAVEELKEAVSEQRSKKLSKREFDDLWSAALGEIETRDEIEVERSEEEAIPQQP